jgi:hypothetical protein
MSQPEPSSLPSAAEIVDSTIVIYDNDRPLRLEYSALLAYHGGGALAGAAIGFRAMAAAGAALSGEQAWDRRSLSVVSWHNGPGVRDAIEFVTRAITRDRFELRKSASAQGCGAASAFRFELADGHHVVSLSLRERAVTPAFFELAATAPRTPQQEAELTRLKAVVADAVMALPTDRLFEISVREQAHA